MVQRMRDWVGWLDTLRTVRAEIDDDDDDEDDEEEDDEEDDEEEEEEEEEGVGGGGGVVRQMDADGLVDGYNVTQLSLMTYKIARSERLFSLAAAPCWEVRGWLPAVVRRLEAELHGFEFFCVDTREEGKEGLEKWYGKTSGGYLKCKAEEIESVLPMNVDLVVSWLGVQKWGVRRSWRFVKGLRRRGVKMVLVSNNGGGGNGQEGRINIRKSPLLFNEPRRVIGKVDREGDVQLLLYEMDGVRDGF